MKILHVAPLAHYGASGFVFSILGLAKAQAAQGHRVGLLCSTPPGLAPEQLPPGVFLLSGPVRRHLNPWSLSRRWLRRIEREFGAPDLVNFHGTYIPFQIALGKLLTRASIPYVHTSRGDLKRVAQNIKPLKKRIANRLFVRRYLAQAAAVHALTREEAAEIAAFAPSLELFVNPNGIDDELIRMPVPAPPERGRTLVLGFVGRVDIYIKGIDLLLSALKELQEVAPEREVRLVVTGPFYTSEDEREFRRLVSRLKRPEMVTYTGALFGPDKFRVLSSCDVFACTSRSEGMPMAVIEAMALGKPCLITPGSNAYDYVVASGCGWYCEESAEAITRCILSIADGGGDIASKGARARAFVEEHLLWSSVASDNVAALSRYLGVMARLGGRPGR